MKHIIPVAMAAMFVLLGGCCNQPETMMYSDFGKTGVPMCKDPHVISFNGEYLMYYSMPPQMTDNQQVAGWNIGIARSSDLIHWEKAGEILPSPDSPCEKTGFCAPCALVVDGRVHLFYQTYGTGRKDAICHSWSDDGFTFTRDPSNPVFAPPVSDWSCGRAIDAEVYKFKDRYFMYFATRDPEYVRQITGVAWAPADCDFSRDCWTLAIDEPILVPELDWEQKCTEAPSVIEKNGRLFLFYAGAYNNCPQQIGVAVSDDGVHFKRVWNEPFLPVGEPGSWNSSESGHPHIFEAPDGRTYLFYQGNDTHGKTWYLSQREVVWKKGLPKLK